MVVGRQTGRTGNARLQHLVARAQGAVELAGLGAEKYHGLNRRERGKVPRPAVVGDQQIGMVKQHQQFADAARVAGQVDAQRIIGQAAQLLGQGRVVFEPDQAYGKAGLAQAFGHAGVMFFGPGALGQDAATGIHQHQAAPRCVGVVGVQLCAVGG